MGYVFNGIERNLNNLTFEEFTYIIYALVEYFTVWQVFNNVSSKCLFRE